MSQMNILSKIWEKSFMGPLAIVFFITFTLFSAPSEKNIIYGLFGWYFPWQHIVDHFSLKILQVPSIRISGSKKCLLQISMHVISAILFSL